MMGEAPKKKSKSSGFCCFGGAAAVSDPKAEPPAPTTEVSTRSVPATQQVSAAKSSLPATPPRAPTVVKSLAGFEAPPKGLEPNGGVAAHVPGPAAANTPVATSVSYIPAAPMGSRAEQKGSDDVVPFGADFAPSPRRDAGSGNMTSGGDFFTSGKNEEFKATAKRVFEFYDSDHDGYLTLSDLLERYRALQLDLPDATFRMYVQNNFTYADRDGDGRLSFSEYFILHRLLSDVHLKFTRYDSDGDGCITKSEFTSIIMDLHLNMEKDMVEKYVNINFKFADRSLKGVVSFGQFLSTYSNFLLSHNIRGAQAAQRAGPAKVRSEHGPRRVPQGNQTRGTGGDFNSSHAIRSPRRADNDAIPGGVEDGVETLSL